MRLEDLQSKRNKPLYESFTFEERFSLFCTTLYHNIEALHPYEYKDLFRKEEIESIKDAALKEKNLPFKPSSLTLFLEPSERIEYLEQINKTRRVNLANNEGAFVFDNEQQKQRALRFAPKMGIYGWSKFIKCLDTQLDYVQVKKILENAIDNKEIEIALTSSQDRFYEIMNPLLYSIKDESDVKRCLDLFEGICKEYVTGIVDYSKVTQTVAVDIPSRLVEPYARYVLEEKKDHKSIIGNLDQLCTPTRNVSYQVFKALKDNCERGEVNEFVFAPLLINVDEKQAKEVLNYVLRGRDKGSVSVGIQRRILNTIDPSYAMNIYKGYDKYFSRATPDDMLTTIYHKDHCETFYNIFEDMIKEGTINYEEAKWVYEYTEAPNRYNLSPEVISIYDKDYPRSNYRKYIQRFGLRGLIESDDNNIRKFLSLEPEKFDKLLHLFDIENQHLDKNDLYTAASMVLNARFRFAHPDTYGMFSRFQNAIEIQDKNEVIDLFYEIGCDNTPLYNKFLEVVGTSVSDLPSTEYMNKLLKNDAKAVNILHDLTNEYIKQAREKNFKENIESCLDLLKVRDDIDEKSFATDAIAEFDTDYIIESLLALPRISDFNTTSRWYNLTKEEQELLKDTKKLAKLIEVRRAQGYPLFKEEIRKINPNELKVVDSLIAKAGEYNKIRLHNKYTGEYRNKYNIPDRDGSLEIIKNINVDNIDFDNLPEIKKLFDKYKLIKWGNIFVSEFEESDITFDEFAIGNIVNYFDIIKTMVSKGPNGYNLIDIIDAANCLSEESSKYKKLFGREDYNYLLRDQNPNSSAWKKSERLKKAASYIKDMYAKKEIPVPGIDENITLSNGKVINVVIGNNTNTINLTYGERSGSCMRIGGFFKDELDFYLKNKHGFQVRFANPENNKYVSRVSGLRNGNTIFFNQLRKSSDSNYTNDDLVEAMDKALELIDEKAKEAGDNNITNVFISMDYAYENKVLQRETEAVPSGGKMGVGFNYVGSKAIVLRNNYDYAFGDKNMQFYPCIRDKVINCDHQQAKDEIIKKIMINEVLLGEQVESIELENNPIYKELIQHEIVDAYIGQDFFIYKDENGVEHKYKFKYFKDDEAIEEEVEQIYKNNEVIRKAS